MNKKEQLKLIGKAYDSLFILNNYRWEAYRDTIQAMNKKEERQHRTGRTAGDCGITQAEAAKIFTVQHVIEGALRERDETEPTILVKSIHQLRVSYLKALSIGVMYSEDILSCFTDDEIEQIQAVNYAKLMKV